jgi:hypothetical protein
LIAISIAKIAKIAIGKPSAKELALGYPPQGSVFTVRLPVVATP